MFYRCPRLEGLPSGSVSHCSPVRPYPLGPVPSLPCASSLARHSTQTQVHSVCVATHPVSPSHTCISMASPKRNERFGNRVLRCLRRYGTALDESRHSACPRRNARFVLALSNVQLNRNARFGNPEGCAQRHSTQTDRLCHALHIYTRIRIPVRHTTVVSVCIAMHSYTLKSRVCTPSN